MFVLPAKEKWSSLIRIVNPFLWSIIEAKVYQFLTSRRCYSFHYDKIAYLLAMMMQVSHKIVLTICLWCDSSRQWCRLQLFFTQDAFPSKFCFIFYVSWSSSQAIATTRAPQSFPFNEYFADLAPLLASRVSTCTNLLLSLMSNANPFTSHLKLSSLTVHYVHNTCL